MTLEDLHRGFLGDQTTSNADMTAIKCAQQSLNVQHSTRVPVNLSYIFPICPVTRLHSVTVCTREEEAADCLPVPHGSRWNVSSSALQWRRLCFLCWRRWHQTYWPASGDFALKDRYSIPPSTCQPGGTETITFRQSSLFDSFTLFLFSQLHTYHFFGNVTDGNFIIRGDILLLQWK